MTRITGGQPTAQGTSCMPATLHPPWQEDEVLERRTGERGASAVSTAVIDAAPQRRSGVGWESMTQIQPTPDADAARSGLDLGDRKSTRLNSSHVAISYAVFCLK